MTTTRHERRRARPWIWAAAVVLTSGAALVPLAEGRVGETLPAGPDSAREHAATRYEVRASDSYVGYRIHKLGMVPVRGHFGSVAGEILLDPEEPERSRASIRVPLASLESGNDRRTATLLSEDFFDARNHPEMLFLSRRATRGPDGRWLVSGDLTIRGVTRTVTVPVEIEAGAGIEGPVVVLSTRFEIDRGQFGVLGERWSGGRTLLSDAVEIELVLTAEEAS